MSLKVRFRVGEATVQSSAREVSTSGMFVPCRRPPPRGTVLALRLMLPDGGGPEQARVMGGQADDDDGGGFRCEFVSLGSAARERLDAAIAAAEEDVPLREIVPPGQEEDVPSLLREIAPPEQEEQPLVPEIDAGQAADSPLRDLVLGALDGEDGNLEPRALVYAAGALGYELLSGKTVPQPPRTAGAELSGSLAAVVPSALSVIRGERPPGLRALRPALEMEEAPTPAEQQRARFAAPGARFNADAPSAPPAATSAPVPPARPAETAPSPPDAEVKIASVEKQVHATQAKLAGLEETVLKQTEEQERMAQDLVAMRSEHDRTVASLGKREEKLLARLLSLETAVRASQVKALRRVPSWRPFAAAAGGGAPLTLLLRLPLGGGTP